MNNIILEEKYILEYIKDMILSFKMDPVDVLNARYHHNTSYCDAPSILKYGILTVSELNRLGIQKYDPTTLKNWSDTDSHANGIDAVSLAVVGLTDLYRDDFEYNPYHPTQVDFVIASDIKTDRSTVNYGNEFLYRGNIEVDKLRAVDVRLLNLIELYDKARGNCSIDSIIDKYNTLRDIALAIHQSNLHIPLRDMSNENLSLDIGKVSKAKKLILK